MSVVRRNNVRLSGNPEAKKTLLFAHGFGTDQRVWYDMLSAFAADYRIVLFDYVGANEQTVPFFNYRKYRQLHAFANDILEIIEELSLTNITLIGHSAGGMSGTLAAIQEPGWFSRLVLLNASPRYVNENGYEGGFDQATLDALFSQMESNFHAWASGFAPMIMGNPNRPHLANAFAQTLSAMRPDVALAIAKAIFYSDHRADITHLPHPTLLVQSRDDVAVPEAVGYYLERHMPNAILAFVDAEGHLPHVSDADEIVRVIRPFLR